jgi:Carboxypeptidase regulatory-like domain
LNSAFGQSAAGTVAYPDGSAVPSAPVQAKDIASGAAVRTATRADGRFTFANLAAGAYETFDVAPQEELTEFVCENNKPQHLEGR